MSSIKRIHVPENSEKGTYSLHIEVVDLDGKKIVSTKSFTVERPKRESVTYIEKVYIGTIVFLIIVASILGYLYIKKKEQRDHKIKRRVKFEDFIKK